MKPSTVPALSTAPAPSTAPASSAAIIPPAGEKLVGSNLQNLSNDIEEISAPSATCTGVCHLMEEVNQEGLASALMIQCDKYDKKF